jgi:hypothetical protein
MLATGRAGPRVSGDILDGGTILAFRPEYLATAANRFPAA